MIRLTRAQVREIDRRSIEEYGIPGIVLMENASRAVVDIAQMMLKDAPLSRDAKRSASVVHIYCGSGNNGGDGFAVARHLHNLDVDVTIVKCFDDEKKLPQDAATNWRIVRAMNLPIVSFADIAQETGAPDLIIDALLGTGAASAPRGVVLDAIHRTLDMQNTPVLAIDVPSGLDCDTGEPLGACIKATRTVTFVAEKAGFANPDSKQCTGEVFVGDIGCPKELIDEISRDVDQARDRSR